MEMLSRRVSRVFDRSQEDIPIITIERHASDQSTAADDVDDDDSNNKVVLQLARPVLGWVSSRQGRTNDDDDDDSCRDLLSNSQLLAPASPR